MVGQGLWQSANHVSTRSAKLLGTGTVVDDCTSITEMLDKAKLSNLQVMKRPLVNREGYTHKDKYEVTYFDDDTLSRKPFENAIVGSKYQCTQVEDAMRIADGIMTLGGTPEQVVVVNGGVKYFLTFKLDNSIKIGGVDKVDMRLVVGSSNDGSMATIFKVIGNQVKCTNQINLILKGRASTYAVRHTKNADANLIEARRTLGIAEDWITELETVANNLADVSMNADQFTEVSKLIYPKPVESEDKPNKRSISKWQNHIDSLREIFLGVGELGNTNIISQTAWTGVSTLIEDIDWYRNSKDNKNSFVRTQQALGYVGNTARNKTKVLSVVQDYVDNQMPKTISVS
jgi:hypothetical protein